MRIWTHYTGDNEGPCLTFLNRDDYQLNKLKRGNGHLHIHGLCHGYLRDSSRSTLARRQMTKKKLCEITNLQAWSWLRRINSKLIFANNKIYSQ